MADIELVIKLDEEYIKQIDKIRFLIGGIEDRSLQINVINAIRNGTPLQKGHGRLVDADELISLMDIVEEENKEDKELHSLNVFAKKLLNDAPKIIEADKEDKDADSN